MRQVKREEVDLLFHPADLGQRLAEVGRRGHGPLIFARRTAYQGTLAGFSPSEEASSKRSRCFWEMLVFSDKLLPL